MTTIFTACLDDTTTTTALICCFRYCYYSNFPGCTTTKSADDPEKKILLFNCSNDTNDMAGNTAWHREAFFFSYLTNISFERTLSDK